MNNISQVSPKIVINSYYNSLPKTEKKIAIFILKNFNDFNNLNMTDIAQELNVSESTIVRFIKRIGYSGFKEFKIYWDIFKSKEISKDNFEEFSDETLDIQAILRANIKSNANNLNIIPDFIDYTVLNQIAECLVKYNKIFIIGAGYSGIIANYLYHLLFTTGKDVSVSNDSFGTQQFTYKVDKKSFVFVISQKGRFTETVKFVNLAKKRGAITSCLTRVASNPLSELVDYPLVINSLTNKDSSNYLLTQISFTIIVNTLFMFVANQLHQINPDYSSEFIDGFNHLYQIIDF